MALTLASVKASFANFIGRDAAATDDWVAGILNTAQLFMSVYDGNHYSWTKVNGGSFVTVDGTGEYDLTSVISGASLLRTPKAIYKKMGTSTAFKLQELTIRNVRLYSPDPEGQYGKGEPNEYYPIKNRGKTIGLIRVPDDVYTFYVDYFVYPPDPTENDLMIPIEWEIALLTLLKAYYLSKNDDEKRHFSAMNEFKSIMKHVTKDDMKDTEDDEPILPIVRRDNYGFQLTDNDFPTPPT